MTLVNPLAPDRQTATYHEVGVLTTGHLMREHRGIGSLDVGIEALVEDTELRPVQIEGLDRIVADPGAERSLFERSAYGAHGRLRGHAGHACRTDVMRNWLGGARARGAHCR